MQSSSRPPSVGKVLSQLASWGPATFKALSEPMRISLLKALACSKQACTVSQLAEGSPVDVSVVSRHLGVLRDCGILRAEKRGREVHYSLSVEELVACLRLLADTLERCCGDATGSAP